MRLWVPVIDARRVMDGILSMFGWVRRGAGVQHVELSVFKGINHLLKPRPQIGTSACGGAALR